MLKPGTTGDQPSASFDSLEGAIADLTLFHPKTVLDRATLAKPLELPVAVEKVFVNGRLVWDFAKATGARPVGY